MATSTLASATRGKGTPNAGMHQCNADRWRCLPHSLRIGFTTRRTVCPRIGPAMGPLWLILRRLQQKKGAKRSFVGLRG